MSYHTMGFCHVFVLAAILQIVFSQDLTRNLPPECMRPPPSVRRPHDCCQIPPFFPKEDFEECGFNQQPRRRGPFECSKPICIMKKHGLMKDDTEIDYEALGVYLDQWAETNEPFKPVVPKVKESCLRKDLPGPPEACESNKLVFCVTSKMFTNCPVWEESEDCKTLKDHLAHCKPFFDEL